MYAHTQRFLARNQTMVKMVTSRRPSMLTCLTTAAATAASFSGSATFPAVMAFTTAPTATTTRLHGMKKSRDIAFMRSDVLYMSTSSTAEDEAAIANGISRIDTLTTLLTKYGAPGSEGCLLDSDDDSIVPITDHSDPELLNLHPHLYPLARSTKSGNYICALRRAYADDADYESSTNAPWPIVEGKLNGPGMKLLALNSEHLMRRIACEADDSGDEDIVALYNEGLGEGILKDKGLDSPYQPGDVAKLGYGVEKYVLLRVGPFPDLYVQMSQQHKSRGDESSALIAAEAANGKFPGFGSLFASYAKLMSTLPNREEETRDAARMCLRMPLPSMGMTEEDFAEVSRLAGLADEKDSTEEAMAKLQAMYEKIRKHEQDQNEGESSGISPQQEAIEDANHILDTTALSGSNWSEVRPKLAEIYRSVGKEDMAKFVESN
mmetsp:Transcript_1088/g.1589  ORF Transcript_1088/g.1589 Transcript_1088/m.1589 type:complete len:436 (-) Transcript_1088:1126-2433(-)